MRTINIHYPTASAAAFVWLKRLRLFKGSLILSLHGGDVTRSIPLKGARASQWRWLLCGSDKITVVSRQLRDVLVSAVPEVSDRVHIIYSGVDADAFEASARARTFPTPNGTVACIAACERHKGIDVLLAAAAIVNRKYGSLKYKFIGNSGTQDEALVQLSKALGIQELIEWHRNVPHDSVPTLLSQADLFVLPSRSEAFGLALLEAGAAGLPTIATPVGGIPEIITDGYNGLLVPPEDPEALAGAIIWMFENPWQAAKMGRLLRQSVVDRFSWRSTCQRYLELMLPI